MKVPKGKEAVYLSGSIAGSTNKQKKALLWLCYSRNKNGGLRARERRR